jgi:transposase-like protein
MTGHHDHHNKDKGGVAPPSKLMRARRKWSDEEVQMLIDAVKKHGTAWSIISKQYDFGDRIAADLKDKYRNLYRRNLIPRFPEAQPPTSDDVIEVPESDGEDSSSSIEE